MRNRRIESARWSGALLCLALVSLLSGCATTPPLSDQTRSSLPERKQIEAVPFHAQRDFQCGPATLAMLLGHEGKSIRVDELIPQVFLPGREGSVQPEMLATVRRHGLIPYVIPGRLDAVLREVAAGRPVGVLQNLSLAWWPMWHYAVVIGYDLDDERLLLHSGETPRMEVSMARFDATWARSDRWAFVALPPGDLPATPVGRETAAAISAFESVQGAEAALPAWRALAERKPDLALAQFGLGNALAAGEARREAARAFRRAVEADPDFAAAWLNLGLIQRSLGRTEQAREALRQAASISGPLQERAQEQLEAADQAR
ncbi:MAG: PA2778 family cysteine peptidase [Guyparkeria sp.]|uniref:PA2778 family cysteine peptidase n=1 Tax=Guyparkeria sp. TaxID=2035736 RepID=UPI003979A3E0